MGQDLTDFEIREREREINQQRLERQSEPKVIIDDGVTIPKEWLEQSQKDLSEIACFNIEEIELIIPEAVVQEFLESNSKNNKKLF